MITYKVGDLISIVVGCHWEGDVEITRIEGTKFWFKEEPDMELDGEEPLDYFPEEVNNG